MNKYFDFDQFMAEKKEEPLVIRIFGEEEELPASLPAELVLRVLAMRKDKGRVVSEAEMFDMASQIFGDKLEKWCKKGLTVAGLEVLFTEVLAMYTEGKPEVKTTKAKAKGAGKATP